MDEHRRRVLAGIGSASIAAIAGCTSTDSTATSPLPASNTPAATSTVTSTQTSTPTSESSSTPSATPTDQATKLVPEDGDEDDSFGWSVAVSNDGSTANIGASVDEDPNGEMAGSAYVFSGSGGAWTQQAKIVADDGEDGDGFGSAVAVSNEGSTAIIGASGDEDPNGEDVGSAYVVPTAELS
ncbi:MAG: FG-GAP repeat protein [Haloarculaceae archaeon]